MDLIIQVFQDLAISIIPLTNSHYCLDILYEKHCFFHLVKALFHLFLGTKLIFVTVFLIGGRIQKYTYRQEPNTKCTGRRPALNYPVYGETAQVRRVRFERAIGTQRHTISIHYSPPVRVLYQDKGNALLFFAVLKVLTHEVDKRLIQ